MFKLHILFLILPLVLADQVVKNAETITLQELLRQHGIKEGQAALVLIAPINGQNGALTGTRALSALSSSSNPILVQSSPQPINVHYKSQSLPLNVKHTHIPAPKPETKLSRSEEEPHRLVHEVIRPVIQEVREIIQPYRRIVQEIRPVQESVVTKISKQQGNNTSARRSTTSNKYSNSSSSSSRSK